MAWGNDDLNRLMKYPMHPPSPLTQFAIFKVLMCAAQAYRKRRLKRCEMANATRC